MARQADDMEKQTNGQMVKLAGRQTDIEIHVTMGRWAGMPLGRQAVRQAGR
jgi:hypothetical protein